jgi:hypothetical protein
MNRDDVVKVRIIINAAVVEIDTTPLDKPNQRFRFSDDQLDELVEMATHHGWQKTDSIADIFSRLHFTKDGAFAFAADVAEWLKTVNVVPPPKPMNVCGDCAHFPRCQRLIQCKEDSVLCDWIPSRFQEKTNANGQKEISERLAADQPANSL